MAVLDQVARDAATVLTPFLSERTARLLAQYLDEAEPVMGLEVALLSLAETGTAVPADVLDRLQDAVDKRAADGGDVEFLSAPLATIRRTGG